MALHAWGRISLRVVVAPLSEFPPGERRIVEAGKRSIGVFRIGDRFYAVRNRCPHMGGPLCQGRIARWVRSSGPGDFSMEAGTALLACPWHGWEYELATGQSFLGPGEPGVKAYEVSVEKGGGLEEREPGPYKVETFPVYVEEDYVVLEA
jgi:nitrite reductase/ring-hydroxylating ferredoxin subunit